MFVQKEEERLRAAVRRESLQKRVRERHSRHSGGITASYLEPDEVTRLFSILKVSCTNEISKLAIIHHITRDCSWLYIMLINPLSFKCSYR